MKLLRNAKPIQAFELTWAITRVDKVSEKTRSEIMRRVRCKDTQPELKVRSLLHKLGYRFRLHGQDLPGNPDIVLPKHRTVIFVHGCFWHRHKKCKRASTPASRKDYWQEKFIRTQKRDKANRHLLKKLGWNPVIIWECEISNGEKIKERVTRLLA